MLAVSRPSLPLLHQFLQLQADYLRQADHVLPTSTHYVDWLRLVHGPKALMPAASEIDPDLPRQLYALPLFRQYMVRCARGTLHDYLARHLPADELHLLQRLPLPAHEHEQLLRDFRTRLQAAFTDIYRQQGPRARPEEYLLAFL